MTDGNNIGICKLCLERKSLIKKSHIIPDFLYKELKNDKNSFYLINSTSIGIERKKTLQTGEFEGGLLCKNCDNIVLNRYERYAASFFNGSLGTDVIISDKTRFKYFQVNGIDYTKFKLFILSILWRADISNRPFFENIKLGPHSEFIRQMLLNDDSGSVETYPIIFFASYSNQNNLHQIIPKPVRAKGNSGTVYKFMFSGLIFWIFISKHSIPPTVLNYTIKPDNTLRVLLMDDTIERMITNSFGLNFL